MSGRQRQVGLDPRTSLGALAGNHPTALHGPETGGIFLLGESSDDLILCYKLLESNIIWQIFSACFVQELKRFP